MKGTVYVTLVLDSASALSTIFCESREAVALLYIQDRAPVGIIRFARNACNIAAYMLLWSPRARHVLNFCSRHRSRSRHSVSSVSDLGALSVLCPPGVCHMCMWWRTTDAHE